jgi:rhamnosyltransferase
VSINVDRRLLIKCEEPNISVNPSISGFTCVRGWAAPRSQIEKIELLIDGRQAGSGFYGFARPDLLRAHPELGSDVHLGFAFRLDAMKLSTGLHGLQIIVTGRNGETASIEGGVKVVVEEPSQTDGRRGAAINRPREPRHSLRSPEGGAVQASVIIFTRNQAELLDRSLPIITGQKTSFRFELVGFDTESEDGTAQVLKRHGARVVSVRRDEFHHVRTRLRSLSEASGEFVIFLVGDAVPADDHWLEALVRPLIEDPVVAAAYSRQLPARDCVPWEERDIYLGCSVVREVKQIDWSQPKEVDNYRKNRWKFISFSDVSSCYRRGLLETLPVVDSLPEVEDQYWCKCLLELGYRVVLEPTSLVIHSHNHSPRELYRRQVRFGRCFATFMDVRPPSIRRLLFETAQDTMADLFYIAGSKANRLRKCMWILQAPVMRLLKRHGLYQGFRLGGFSVDQVEGCALAHAKTSTEAVPAERSK